MTNPCPRCGHAVLHTAQQGCVECACDTLVDWLGPVTLRESALRETAHSGGSGSAGG